VKRIYIVTPGATVTGGPELCHQLGDALNRETERAWIVYTPFDTRSPVPQPYARYNVKPANRDKIKRGSIVVLPETYSELVGEFPGSEIYFWWLSVDHFFNRVAKTAPARVARKSIPIQLVVKFRLDRLRRNVHRHLYQSEYARLYLDSVGLRPYSRLSDYIADDYTRSANVNTERENIVVYNPAKGIEQTSLILRALEKCGSPMPEVVALRGMSRSEIRDLFQIAKVYIDFGTHPGKDRIPREAVALGACTVVNRRGSAANAIDIPIPEEFKIDDSVRGFEKFAVARIRDLLANFDQQTLRFQQYRQSIALESAKFLADVDAVFPPCG
jgi:hypothetical protein